MIDIKTFVYIISFLIAVGGMIGAFFTMQTKQTMKINQLEKEVQDVQKRQEESSHHQLDTEKSLIEMSKDIKQILKDVEELKMKGFSHV